MTQDVWSRGHKLGSQLLKGTFRTKEGEASTSCEATTSHQVAWPLLASIYSVMSRLRGRHPPAWVGEGRTPGRLMMRGRVGGRRGSIRKRRRNIRRIVMILMRSGRRGGAGERRMMIEGV